MEYNTKFVESRINKVSSDIASSQKFWDESLGVWFWCFYRKCFCWEALDFLASWQESRKAAAMSSRSPPWMIPTYSHWTLRNAMVPFFIENATLIVTCILSPTQQYSFRGLSIPFWVCVTRCTHSQTGTTALTVPALYYVMAYQPQFGNEAAHMLSGLTFFQKAVLVLLILVFDVDNN